MGSRRCHRVNRLRLGVADVAMAVSAVMAVMVAGCASGDSGDAGDAGAPASGVSVIDSEGPTATTSMVTSAASDLPVIEASVDDASVAGLRIDQQPATVDDALAALQSLAGAPTADSGWQPIPAGQSCHLYAESRTIWWGDLRLSFARGHLEAPADDLSEPLVAWAVGVVQAPSIVPLLGTRGAAVVDVRLDGAISVGATQEALEALVADKGYFFIQPGVVSAGGRPLFLGLGEGVLTGFAAGLDECYDDPSGM